MCSLCYEVIQMTFFVSCAWLGPRGEGSRGVLVYNMAATFARGAGKEGEKGVGKK
jgi:hypothetical protein